MTLPDVQLLSPPPCCGRSLGVTSKASFCDVRAGVLVTRVLKARCNSSSSKPGLGVAGLIPATAAKQVWSITFFFISQLIHPFMTIIIKPKNYKKTQNNCIDLALTKI